MIDETKTAAETGVEEEDDFEFGNTGKESGESGKETEGGTETETKTVVDDNKSGNEEGTGQSSDEDGGELETGKEKGESEEEISGSGEQAEGGEKGAGEQKAEGAETGEGETDFFGEEFSEAGKEKEGETFDFKALAPEFGIELEEGSPEEFKNKISERIEASKQEFKVDEYSPDAQLIIKHLNDNDGKIEDFFNNKTITSLQSVIGLNPEQKVLMVRTNELTKAGLDEEKAREKAEEEIEQMSIRELKNVADVIDTDASKLISDEVNNIVTGREQIISKQKEKSKIQHDREVETLKSHVNSLDEFMGIKLTLKAKQNIVSQIESGEFDEITDKDPAASKFRAYMLTRYGKKIAENYSKIGSVQNRKGHNAALESQVGALHNTKESAKSGGTGHQKNEGGEKGRWDGFSDDVFDDEG